MNEGRNTANKEAVDNLKDSNHQTDRANNNMKF